MKPLFFINKSISLKQGVEKILRVTDNPERTIPNRRDINERRQNDAADNENQARAEIRNQKPCCLRTERNHNEIYQESHKAVSKQVSRSKAERNAELFQKICKPAVPLRGIVTDISRLYRATIRAMTGN